MGVAYYLLIIVLMCGLNDRQESYVRGPFENFAECSAAADLIKDLVFEVICKPIEE